MHAEPGQTAHVVLLSPPFTELTYTLPEYLPPDAFFVGQRVAVPLGKGLRVGLISSFAFPDEPVDNTADKAPYILKALVWPLEKDPLLSEKYLDLALQLAHRQTETLGRILGSVLPAGLRTTQTRIRFFGQGKPKEYKPKNFLVMAGEERNRCGELWMAGKAEVCRAGQNPLDAEVCVLASDPPWPVRPAATAQTAVLEYLFEQGAVTRRKLGQAFGPGAANTLNTLAGRGLVHIIQADCADQENPLTDGPPICPPFETPDGGLFHLTPSQQKIFAPLLAAVHSGKAESRLLFGITGSGKTAIYLELCRIVLSLGKSALLLAPEVALALKLWGDVKAALPPTLLPENRRLLFHGYQSASAKESAFAAMGRAKNEPRLVVGTRSALLLPLDNIGLIILDEEHDASFKQDEGVTYQAKEVAWYRAKQQSALLLMGSATPDLKSFHAAREGLLPLHTLTERVGGGALPEVRLVHLPKGEARASLLAEESLTALNEVVGKGEQAVILLNRRGYAPLMYCRSCNRVAKCPHCDIGLAYHKGRERLLCHYCGYAMPYPSPCSACKCMSFLPMGEGTEKLEESLSTALPPGARVLRLDKDSTRRPGRMEEILASFARKEASVLVGTQMLSKGHHFPDVTLAIVADADLGLNLPDYRAAERTFQLLVQSSGRAGRGNKAGQVLIQTRDPGHYCWEYVKNADYEGFFEHELALRQKHRYPPFVRLALIRISCPVEQEDGQEAVKDLGKILRQNGKELGVTVLGPAPAPIPFLMGRRRWQCMLKADDWQPLRTLFSKALAASRKSPLRLRLDLDPVNMM